MNNDITVIYYSANLLDEPFFTNVQKQIIEASCGAPIISVTHKPINFGTNICVGELPISPISIYKQVLIGAREAKTKYVVMAEDDILYSKEHFFYPIDRDDVIYFNVNRWMLFTWKPHIGFSLNGRKINGGMFTSRDYLVDALEERYAKYPDESKINVNAWGEPGRYDDVLKVTLRNTQDVKSDIPIVQFNHPKSLCYKSLGTKKKVGSERVQDLPYWGNAIDVFNKFYLG
jgi:hypothetical protein